MFRNGREGNLRRSGSSWDWFAGMTDCGRSLRQSQPAGPHGSCYICRVGSSLIVKLTQPAARFARGRAMFSFSDLFQWDRFITPTIIKTFYWLVIALICLFGLSGIFSGLAMMAISPFGGFLMLLSSIASVVVGIVFSRILAELILIIFRINEHLGAIRDQGGGVR